MLTDVHVHKNMNETSQKMHVTDVVFRRVSTPEASTVSCVSVSLWCAEERISHSYSQLSESCTSWALGTSPCFNCWRLAHELRAEILMQWRNKSNITRWLERWRNPQGVEFSFDAGGIYTDTERRVKLVKNNEESSLQAKKNKKLTVEWWGCTLCSIVFTKQFFLI